MISVANNQSGETLEKDSSLPICLDFGKKFEQEDLARKVFSDLFLENSSANVERNVDEVLLEFGGEFFYQLFLLEIKKEINELELTSLENQPGQIDTTEQTLQLLRQIQDPFRYFQSAVDKIFSKDILSASRFKIKFTEIARDLMMNEEDDSISQIEAAIREVGNNIFADKNFN